MATFTVQMQNGAVKCRKDFVLDPVGCFDPDEIPWNCQGYPDLFGAGAFAVCSVLPDGSWTYDCHSGFSAGGSESSVYFTANFDPRPIACTYRFTLNFTITGVGFWVALVNSSAGFLGFYVGPGGGGPKNIVWDLAIPASTFHFEPLSFQVRNEFGNPLSYSRITGTGVITTL